MGTKIVRVAAFRITACYRNLEGTERMKLANHSDSCRLSSGFEFIVRKDYQT